MQQSSANVELFLRKVERMPVSRNAKTAVGLVAFVSVCSAIPLWSSYTMKNKQKNLTQSEKALTGTQVIRGAYLNTGSKDAGVDPDWDFENRVWRGKRTQHPPRPEGFAHQPADAAPAATSQE